MFDQSSQQISGNNRDGQGAGMPGTGSDLVRAPQAHLAPLGAFGGRVEEQPPSGAMLLSMLMQYKGRMLVIALVIAGVSIPAIWFGITPQYRATAVFRVSPVISRIVFRNEDNRQVPYYSNFLNTQVNIVRSPVVLQRVLDRSKVRETAWYNEKPRTFLGSPLSHMERLTNALAVGTRRNTELISVAIAADVASDAKTIVDAVVEEFIKFSDESSDKAEIQRLDTLRRDITKLQNEIEALNRLKLSTSKKLGTVNPEQLRSQLAIKLSTLEQERGGLGRALAMAEWELETRRAEKQGTQGEDAQDADGDENFVIDAEWRRLNRNLQAAEHQAELARQRFGEAHPRIKELQATVAYAESLLAERVAQLQKQGPESALALAGGADGNISLVSEKTLSRMILRQKRALELLGEQIQNQRVIVAEKGDLAQEISQYDQEIRHTTDKYQLRLARLDELQLEGKAPARISLASPALKPSRPNRDRRILFSVAALAAAMTVALGFGYIKSSVNPRILAAGDVRRAVKIPFLGQLPPLPVTADLSGEGDPLMVESMRMIRTALLKRLAGTDKQVVLITSSSSQAGKTTVAILLAQSLARLGKKTLLIEGDLRSPSVSRRLFGFESKVGLSAILAGLATDGEAILPTNTPRCDVVPAGHQPENFNFEMLANGVFAECLDRWRDSYDIILLDSPPVLPVADARILAGHADGTLMVLRSCHCRRAEVVQAYADLSAAGGALLGTVLVGVKPSAQYGYGYGYGYAPPSRMQTEPAGSLERLS